MAVVQFYSPVDLHSDLEWNWVVTGMSASQISIAGPVFAATFQGSFTFNQAGVFGTLNSASQYKNGILQFSVSGLSLDASTVAHLVDTATAEATYAFILQGNDTQIGSSNNDLLGGFGGNDSIDGKEGLDVAYYSGARANYTITRTGTAYTVTDTHGGEGTDTLVNVERLQFSDQWVALDIGGNAGMAYRLYKAAFDRLPDLGGLGFQMNALDTGHTLTQVAANFIASPEFQTTYGNVTNEQFVTLLYRNVLDREPEPEGLAYHVNRLSIPGVTRADILVGFSESPENQANVIGQIENGMVYTF